MKAFFVHTQYSVNSNIVKLKSVDASFHIHTMGINNGFSVYQAEQQVKAGTRRRNMAENADKNWI